MSESLTVIANKILPKTTTLACPRFDEYNDHESTERKSTPFMMSCY